MRRISVGAMACVGLLTFALLDNWSAAQQFDPMPLDDADTYDTNTYETELPQPTQIPDQDEHPRDFSRAYLGITFDPEVSDAAVARAVSAGGPADLAGVRAGDTIVSLNGRRVGSYQDVLRTIGELKAGEVLEIDISRRVSLHARAILDGTPLNGQRTSAYRMESEVLPVPTPATAQPRPRATTPRYNTSPQRPPQNNNAANNRRNNSNRYNNANDRNNNRNRGLMRGRRS